MAAIQKTTLKRFNGTDWDSIFLATSADITRVGETWQIMGQKIGAYNPGDTVNETDMVSSVLKKMTQTRIPATYSQPSVSLTATSGGSGQFNPGNYEAGTVMAAKLTAVFTKNDAGDLTDLKITKNGESVVNGASSPQEYTWSETIGDGTTTFVATAAYKAGEIKDDNLGDPSPSGSIQAGSKTANRAYTGIRKYFYGADSKSEQTAIADSAGIRALTASAGAASKGTKFSINVPKGSTRCTIAFLSTIGTLAQVLYRESGNANITSQFKLTTVEVEGANGFTAKTYNVYTVTWAQPTAGAMTFDVTI